MVLLLECTFTTGLKILKRFNRDGKTHSRAIPHTGPKNCVVKVQLLFIWALLLSSFVSLRLALQGDIKAVSTIAQFFFQFFFVKFSFS